MLLYLIIGIIVGAVAVNFALQNTEPVTVVLVAWQFTAPLSLVILGAVAVGLSIAALALVPGAIGEAIDRYVARREARKAQASYDAAPNGQLSA